MPHNPPRPAARRLPARELHIDVSWRLLESWRALALLRRVAEYTARAEGYCSGWLSVAVVDGRTMSRLHRRSLGLPGPTDVLAFDLGCNLAAGRIDAEVILCADLARRWASGREGGLRAARAELALYLVHGILHLAGYDDRTPADFQRMHRREDRLLTQLGLGPVFRCRAGTISRAPCGRDR